MRAGRLELTRRACGSSSHQRRWQADEEEVFQRQIIYCAPVLRQCCRGRPACRGTGGWRSRSWTKLPHLGRHGTVPGRGDCTISTPHPGPCSRSKSITTHLHLVLGCKASSSRHHLGLASWTQAHKHRSTGKKTQGWGRQSSRGQSISRPTAHLPHLCNLARSTNAPVPTRSSGLAVSCLPSFAASSPPAHPASQPASLLSLPLPSIPSAAPTSSPAS